MTIGFVAATSSQPCLDDVSACALLGVEPAGGDDDGALLQAAMRDHAANVDPEVLPHPTGPPPRCYGEVTTCGSRWLAPTPGPSGR